MTTPGRVRQTSVEAYDALQDALPSMRWSVYADVYDNGPTTSGEHFARQPQTSSTPLTQSRARFTELHEMGLIQEIGTRPCKITGRRCIVWDVTSKVEADPMAQRVTTKDLLSDAEERIEELEAMLASAIIDPDAAFCPGCRMKGQVKVISKSVAEQAVQGGKYLMCGGCGWKLYPR